jgi:hypothetical protein
MIVTMLHTSFYSLLHENLFHNKAFLHVHSVYDVDQTVGNTSDKQSTIYGNTEIYLLI